MFAIAFIYTFRGLHHQILVSSLLKRCMFVKQREIIFTEMIEIRKANFEDLKSLVKLFDEYRMFYEKESDIVNAEKFISERLLQNDSVIYVAANAEGKLTGFVQLYPIFSSTRMKRLWLLNDLYVEKEHRGKGISKQLIAFAKQLCKQTNACGLILETAKSNIIGNGLYPKVGFTLDNEHNYYFWDNVED
jgi:GNAT superfamily N-acetyltransferase